MSLPQKTVTISTLIYIYRDTQCFNPGDLNEDFRPIGTFSIKNLRAGYVVHFFNFTYWDQFLFQNSNVFVQTEVFLIVKNVVWFFFKKVLIFLQNLKKPVNSMNNTFSPAFDGEIIFHKFWLKIFSASMKIQGNFQNGHKISNCSENKKMGHDDTLVWNFNIILRL